MFRLIDCVHGTGTLWGQPAASMTAGWWGGGHLCSLCLPLSVFSTLAWATWVILSNSIGEPGAGSVGGAHIAPGEGQRLQKGVGFQLQAQGEGAGTVWCSLWNFPHCAGRRARGGCSGEGGLSTPEFQHPHSRFYVTLAAVTEVAGHQVPFLGAAHAACLLVSHPCPCLWTVPSLASSVQGAEATC